MNEEEIQALKTELDTSKADLETTRTELEGIKAEKETFTSELEAKVASITTLEQSVATLTAEKETLGSSVRAETQQVVKDLTDSYTLAVSAYKKALAQANPGVPLDMLTGDTIDTVDQSLVGAQALVEQVRASITAEINAGKVPAGAPARTPPDLSAMSAREKIAYAVNKVIK